MNRIYKCAICGNVVELLHDGDKEIFCCEKPMGLLREKTEDQGKEKHIPVIEIGENLVIVKVGEIPHPMENTHYIEWIEIITENGNWRKFLKPEDQPEAKFKTSERVKKARIYCNIHGIWKK